LFLRSSVVEMLSIDVMNELGQRIIHLDRFDPARDAIDLSQLPEGMLLVNVTSSAGRTTLRVVHTP
jgi:hypothetical protein